MKENTPQTDPHMSDNKKSFSFLHPETKEEITLPLINGTFGPSAIDIRTLYQKTGLFTYDPGFSSTASCDSSITYIDGEKGILSYRGYPIEQLSESSDFMEVAFLLLKGQLPSHTEKKKFEKNITHHSLIHEQMYKFLNGFRRDAHPMAIMVGMVGALSSFYHRDITYTNSEEREVLAHRLIGKMPTIAAMAFKYSVGQPYVYPLNDLKYTENFLRMCFTVPSEKFQSNAVLTRAMDRIFILHADHEQNASTSTVRLAASSGANPFACIAAGIASLWGPSHGGANEAVLSMIKEIGCEKNIPTYIQKAKDKNDPFRLMGFGHRVYKNYDPRAKVMRKTCYEVLQELDLEKDPSMRLALELERIALEDDYFIEKKLYPNVDFYSGIILKALGFPTSMFTVLFALARTVGWVAQWNEMMQDPDLRIGRPRQIYKGEFDKKYISIDNR